MAGYDSFLLRIWHGRGPGGDGWASRLEHVQDGRSVRFTSPEELLAYLQDVIRPPDGPSTGEQPISKAGEEEQRPSG